MPQRLSGTTSFRQDQKRSGKPDQKRSEKSKADGALTPAEQSALYRSLILARGAESRIREEYFKDEMKTPVHLGVGQEAIPVGVCHALPRGTKTFGTYRNHALYLAMTGDTDGFFAELYGKATGPCKGKAGSMHLALPERGLVATSAVVGTTIPVAVGAALANQYLKSGDWVASFFGDGAAEEGVFWESVNFACLRRLRILFVCEDNGLAIHTAASQREGFRSIPEAVLGFQCHVATGDGADLPGVVRMTRKMLRRMEEDPRPGFLHLTCFRFLEHVGPKEDFEAGYRRRPTPEEMERLDPVIRYEKHLAEQGVAAEELARVRSEVQRQIQRSVDFAKQAPFAPPAELYTDLFA